MQIFAILQPFSQYPWVPTFIIQFGNHSNNTIWQLTILFGNKSLTLLQQRTAQCTITNLDTLMILLPVIILLPTLRILSPTLRILLPTITSKERDFLARQYWLRRQLLFGIERILLQIPSANAEGGEVQFKLHAISPPRSPFAPRRQILLEELDLSKTGNFFDTNIPLPTHDTPDPANNQS